MKSFLFLPCLFAISVSAFGNSGQLQLDETRIPDGYSLQDVQQDCTNSFVIDDQQSATKQILATLFGSKLRARLMKRTKGTIAAFAATPYSGHYENLIYFVRVKLAPQKKDLQVRVTLNEYGEPGLITALDVDLIPLNYLNSVRVDKLLTCSNLSYLSK